MRNEHLIAQKVLILEINLALSNAGNTCVSAYLFLFIKNFERMVTPSNYEHLFIKT